MTSKSKMLIVDGHSLSYRAFHALPVDKFSSPQGVPVNAVYGLASMLVNLLSEQKPTHFTVCFDEGRDTFRKKIYPEYKANRSASPEDFKVQMSLIRSFVESLGVISFSDSQYEADDLIATISNKAASQGISVVIVTSDRDSFQLINNEVSVLYPKKGLSDVVLMTPIELENKYGLTPSQYADFAALRGDPSDNLPGIPGVGEKTATSWIQKYGSLESLIAHQAELPGKIGESFRNNVVTVETNATLTKLVKDVTLNVSIEDLAWRPEYALDSISFASELGFKSLLPRYRSLIGIDSVNPKVVPQVDSSFNSIYVAEEFLELRESGISDKIDYATVEELNTIIERATSKQECAISDLKYLARRYLELGSRLPLAYLDKLIDVVICEYLINPGSRPELSEMIESPEDNQLFSTKKSENLDLVQRIAESYLKLQGESDFNHILELHKRIEGPVAMVLAELEFNGIAVNTAGLADMIEKKTQEQLTLEKRGHDIHGRSFNFGSPKQLQEVLFIERGLQKTKKTKTGFTTDAEALDFLIEKHPDQEILLVIKEWRETSKIKQMLISLQEAIKEDRIHTTFKQTIAATGRLSSIKPNLQNVPVRTPAGRAIRELFIAAPPYDQLITADYSQIELRVMAHLAQDAALIAAFKSGEDLHVSVASQIHGIDPDSVTSEIRNQIKAVSYGLAYGLSSYGLSQSLKIDVDEADRLMNQFFDRFSGVRDYLRKSVEEAKVNGFTETVLGRRRYFPDLNHENRFRREVAERAALNAPIQGSAADIIKLAMIKLNQNILKKELRARMVLQVHDELVLEVSEKDLSATVELTRNTMENVIDLLVPLDVSIGIGPNWLAAAH